MTHCLDMIKAVRTCHRSQLVLAKALRTSAYCWISWEMFMLQNLGPHMEQKCAVLAGS